MKKAIVIRAFSADSDFLAAAEFLQSEADFARCFDRAMEFGFEAVQLFLSPQGFLSLECDDRRAESIARRARDIGIELTSLEIEPFSFSLTDDDPDVRRQGESTVRRAMQVAAVMEAPGVLVIPGYVGLPWDPSAKPVRYDLAYERLRESLRALAPTAEQLGVTVMIENTPDDIEAVYQAHRHHEAGRHSAVESLTRPLEGRRAIQEREEDRSD